jgi:hypothetical protein
MKLKRDPLIRRLPLICLLLVPAFVATARQAAADATAQAPPATKPADAPVHAWLPTADYRTNTVEGWTVNVSPELDREPALCHDVLDLLRVHLFEVKRVLPPAAAAKLEDVTIWAELNEHKHPGLVYHPDAGWLRRNGVNPDKARCVEIANARNYLSWTREQPYAVLHELSHAWHHQFADGGFENADARAAYDAAKAAGVYDKVLHINGRRERAYAMTNPQEYFAELSEAYFGTNDFYPFVRAELKEHDLKGFELMRKMWGK